MVGDQDEVRREDLGQALEQVCAEPGAGAAVADEQRAAR
jgi:hypothetical protein